MSLLVLTSPGLGSGLTPSGDDFTGGLLFALHVLQNIYPGSTCIELPVELHSARTNLIGLTLLRDLAQGHALAPLHEITHGLIGGDPFESLDPFIGQLIRVGSSAGWDLLTGLLTGFLSTSPQLDQSMQLMERN